jgi:phosphoglycolate phosphatase-like HAD superfamily hydrolase
MRLVIFDIDGTLTNTLNVDDLSYLEAVKEICCIDINEAEWQEIKAISTGTDSGITMNIFYRYFHRVPKDAEIESIRNRFYAILNSTLLSEPDSFSEIDGAYDFIRELQSKNDIKIAVATGCWNITAEMKLKAIGVDSRQFPLSTADDYMVRKDIVRNAIDSAKKFYNTQEFEKVFYIGDGHWDFLASKELNVEFIGIDYGYSGLLDNLGADRVVNDFALDREIILGFLSE